MAIRSQPIPYFKNGWKNQFLLCECIQVSNAAFWGLKVSQIGNTNTNVGFFPTFY